MPLFKSKTELKLEKSKPFGPKGCYLIEKREITGRGNNDPSLKIGEVVQVRNWGTFGCWDTKNRWVDFYASKSVEIVKNWNQR